MAGGLYDLESLPGWTPLGGPRSASASPQPAPPAGKPASPPLQPPSKGAPPGTRAAGAAWVRTDEDVCRYFDEHGGSGVQFFYALREESAAGGSASGGASWDAATGAGDYCLRVVPPERCAQHPSYFIISQRAVVHVQRGCEHTDVMPLAEWRHHKQAFLHMRDGLKFFGSFGLAKSFALWRLNARRSLHSRCGRQLERRLLLAQPTFQGPLLEAASLLERVRGVRAAHVQPSRRYTLEEWGEQQAAWRASNAQPELDAAAAALAHVAEQVCGRVEASAAAMLAEVKPSELSDRIGVDLHAATSKSRARSMQEIKAGKVARAAAYHRALAERAQLPRFLRMLDLRLASALADGAAASVAEAVGVLRAAAPALLQRQAAAGTAEGDAPADGGESETDGEAAEAAGDAGPALLSHVGVSSEGALTFAPTEGEWAAALQEEVVGSSARLAGGVPPLLALPAFARYQEQLAGGAGEEQQQQQQQRGSSSRAAADLALVDALLAGAAAEQQALVSTSFAEARRLAQRRYAALLPVHRFGEEWSFEAWQEEQRAALDIGGADELLRRLRGWRAQLEGMALAQPAGLLRLDAAGLQAALAPLVSAAQEAVSGRVLESAGGRCRALLGEAAQWLELAAARPQELEPFLAWRAELGRLQAAAGGMAETAAATDAALELVAAFTGRLPTADAVKQEDLREAAARLPVELAAAAAWAEEQRPGHGAAVAEQAAAVADEAVLLEAEVQTGAYIDASSPAAEVLSDLELARARMGQLVAQAGELARLRRELEGGGEPAAAAEEQAEEALPWQLADAEAALHYCSQLWGLVAEAEALRDAGSLADEGESGTAAAGPEPAAAEALRARLVALRGEEAGVPPAVWLRASTALRAAEVAQ